MEFFGKAHQTERGSYRKPEPAPETKEDRLQALKAMYAMKRRPDHQPSTPDWSKAEIDVELSRRSGGSIVCPGMFPLRALFGRGPG